MFWISVALKSLSLVTLIIFFNVHSRDFLQWKICAISCFKSIEKIFFPCVWSVSCTTIWAFWRGSTITLGLPKGDIPLPLNWKVSLERLFDPKISHNVVHKNLHTLSCSQNKIHLFYIRTSNFYLKLIVFKFCEMFQGSASFESFLRCFAILSQEIIYKRNTKDICEYPYSRFWDNLYKIARLELF